MSDLTFAQKSERLIEALIKLRNEETENYRSQNDDMVADSYGLTVSEMITIWLDDVDAGMGEVEIYHKNRDWCQDRIHSTSDRITYLMDSHGLDFYTPEVVAELYPPLGARYAVWDIKRLLDVEFL